MDGLLLALNAFKMFLLQYSKLQTEAAQNQISFFIKFCFSYENQILKPFLLEEFEQSDNLIQIFQKQNCYATIKVFRKSLEYFHVKIENLFNLNHHFQVFFLLFQQLYSKRIIILLQNLFTFIVAFHWQNQKNQFFFSHKLLIFMLRN